MSDAELARELAIGAGDLLLALRAEGRLSGRALGDAGDARANDYLVERLSAERPEDALLSEERADSEQRLAMARVWIVDPLDGTREYGEGRDDWAVHVGLAIDGEAAAGAVALPALGQVFDSADPPPLAEPADPPRILVSRSRAPAEADKLAAELGASLVPMGSAGAKTMAVLRGEAELYFHAGGQYEWDNCAPVAVARAAGLDCRAMDGSPLRYNRSHPYVPNLVVGRAELVDRTVALCRSFAAGND